jgi:hypothetical protein
MTALQEHHLTALHQTRIRFRGRVNDVSFAPDEPSLAVAGGNRVAAIIDLNRGCLAERYGGFRSSIGHVLHVGGGAFIAGERCACR